MYQKRQTVITRMPIPRTGTKYVARTKSHLYNSVPVVIAVRDILKLARTNKEVKKMINDKLLKINGKDVKDPRESIRLFNLFEADKTYILTLSKTHRFTLEESKSKKERLTKVTGKTLIKNSKIQFNLHDGSNIISDKKINTNDSLYLDLSGKITKHVVLEKGKSVFVISGKYSGLEGKVKEVKERVVSIKLDDKEDTVELSPNSIIVRWIKKTQWEK